MNERFLHTGWVRCVAVLCGVTRHRTAPQSTASGVNGPRERAKETVRARKRFAPSAAVGIISDVGRDVPAGSCAVER